jgi:hypothetical protein
MIAQPAARIVRLLGLVNGSLLSGRIELHVSFAICCFVHDFQMLIVTHRDLEEFVFFMSQPAAVSIEGLTQEISNQVRPQGARLDNTGPALASYAGYAWAVSKVCGFPLACQHMWKVVETQGTFMTQFSVAHHSKLETVGQTPTYEFLGTGDLL